MEEYYTVKSQAFDKKGNPVGLPSYHGFFYWGDDEAWERRDESTGVPRVIQSVKVTRKVPPFVDPLIEYRIAIHSDWIIQLGNHFHFRGMSS